MILAFLRLSTGIAEDFFVENLMTVAHRPAIAKWLNAGWRSDRIGKLDAKTFDS